MGVSRGPGRPWHESVYKEEYCEKLLDHMSEGKSILSFAASIGVSRSTIYEWKKTHPRFKEAADLGDVLSFSWWEEQGRDGLWEVTEYDEKGRPQKTKRLNTVAWIFNMKARFGFGRDKKPQVQVTQNTNVIEESSEAREVFEHFKSRISGHVGERKDKKE